MASGVGVHVRYRQAAGQAIELAVDRFPGIAVVPRDPLSCATCLAIPLAVGPCLRAVRLLPSTVLHARSRSAVSARAARENEWFGMGA